VFAKPTSVVFDIGHVLFDWDMRLLYAKLIDGQDALDAFLRDVVTMEWHAQHDAGRPFAETSAELTARHPEHRELIAAYGPVRSLPTSWSPPPRRRASSATGSGVRTGCGSRWSGRNCSETAVASHRRSPSLARRRAIG